MFTILGASGFIGSRLTASLRASGAEVATPARGDETYLENELGHVVYCAGVTSDFLSRPFDTIDAHVTGLMPILRHGRFDSLVYLSSTRVYLGALSGAEDVSLPVRPDRPNDLYNISKLMGESACLSSGRSGVRVVRLSNVYGAGMPRLNFLGSVIADALEHGHVALRTTRDSTKDYVALEDVLGLLPRIATEGRQRIYNLAAGHNVANGEIMDALVRLTGCRVSLTADAARIAFPPIDTRRLRMEFDFVPAALADRLGDLVAALHSEYLPVSAKVRSA
jgi:nucleoside-diphosphate-sugar epimerase